MIDVETLKWSAERHEGQPAHASLRFDGGQHPARGAILRSAPDAPVNGMTFESRYTIEACIKLPDPFEGDHALPVGRWTHVAVVNDRRRTVVYVDGSKIARNPTQPSTLGRPFAIGGTQFALTYGQGYHGWIGDVRIMSRALKPREFLTPYE